MTTTRRAAPADRDALAAVVRAQSMFGPDEAAAMEAALDAWAAGAAPEAWLVHAAPEPLGAAMLGREAMADRVANLLFVGVRPEGRRAGLGRALVSAAEAAARDEGMRMMLIDTADVPEMAPARALYEAMGYGAVATVPDYWAEGVAKVTFSRRL